MGKCTEGIKVQHRLNKGLVRFGIGLKWVRYRFNIGLIKLQKMLNNSLTKVT